MLMEMTKPTSAILLRMVLKKAVVRLWLILLTQVVGVGCAATAVVDQGGPSVGDGSAEGHAQGNRAITLAMLLLMMLLTGARRPGKWRRPCR